MEEQLKVIPKSELKEGHWYINKNNGRGMRVGMWDGAKFRTFKGPKFGMYSEYNMVHVEDDDGYVVFEPIQDITPEGYGDEPPPRKDTCFGS